MTNEEWLEKVAYIGDSKIEGSNDKVYYSKHDNSYITHVGMEDQINFLAEREITDQLTHGVGFSPKDKKWYGWSHRAIHGFEIGSTCSKGDWHYIGSSEDEQKEAAIQFWMSDSHKNVRCEGIIKRSGDRFFDIKWEYADDIANEDLGGTTNGNGLFIGPIGRGEWVAKTMDDAKQMAVDFNEGVAEKVNAKMSYLVIPGRASQAACSLPSRL